MLINEIVSNLTEVIEFKSTCILHFKILEITEEKINK